MGEVIGGGTGGKGGKVVGYELLRRWGGKQGNQLKSPTKKEKWKGISENSKKDEGMDLNDEDGPHPKNRS